MQFTPDMLPADIVGTMIYNPHEGSFVTKHGPIFANLVLADEINRAPAKVQSALLEAMQERQVTLGETSYRLPEPFLVLATQNPIEQEGTYPLPEAQVDRFLLKLRHRLPVARRGARDPRRDGDERAEPARRAGGVARRSCAQARHVVNRVYVDDKIRDYIVDIVVGDARSGGVQAADSPTTSCSAPRRARPSR